jgi:hypothetical protein
MPIRPETDAIIEFLNEVARIDAAFLGRLVAARVPCNDAILNHPTIQAGTAREFSAADGHVDDLVPVCGLLGIFNGYCGTFDDGPKRGWGPLSMMIEVDGSVSSVFRTPNKDEQ